MSHFHSKSKSKLVLDLTDASHFILLILSLHILAQLLSSSLNLLRWNWETQSRVTFFEQHHYTWFARFRLVQQACVLSVFSRGKWGRKKMSGREWWLPHMYSEKKNLIIMLFCLMAYIISKSWIFIGRTDAKAEAPILWPPDAKNWLTGKDPDAEKDWRQEEKGMTEDEMVGWHHWLDAHEFEQAPGDGEGQGSLVCCSPWGCKGSEMTEQLNWTDFI